MGEKTFNLTWNNHLANLSGLFEGLYKSGSLTDTTLACQGGMLRAHRLVLAACSPYFERVFKEHYGEQPILILRGVTVEEMECLLDFMYRGSINVSEEHLPSLIKTATDLEIRGLSGDQRNDTSNVYSRIESRTQTAHPETKLQMDYRKHVSFLQKPNDSVISDIKMEELEVEDDPMIMESNEDSLEASLPLAKESVRHLAPQMFKQRTANTRSTPSDDSFDNDLEKSEDPTVPAIQMNEDSMDPGRSVATPEVQSSQDIGKKMEIKQEEDKSSTTTTTTTKEPKKASKSSKAQYKPFPCDLCTLAFTRASHLARHRRVHTGERPFGCTLCPRMFARQDKLKQHLDSHLQWPKRRGLGLNLTPQQQQQQQLNLLARGKRGRPRKASMEQSAMEEILKFGEFSSLLNKSSYPTNKPGKRVDFDLTARNDEVEDLRAPRKDSQLANGNSGD